MFTFCRGYECSLFNLYARVTIPLRDYGKVEGYKYLRHRVEELREQLPLIGMNKDDNIQLTSGGLGYDYQVSTVAYYRYDRDQLPDDEELIADLQNVVENYRQYVEEHMNQEQLTYDETEEDQEHSESLLSSLMSYSVFRRIFATKASPTLKTLSRTSTYL